jgi:hypothetical protein
MIEFMQLQEERNYGEAALPMEVLPQLAAVETKAHQDTSSFEQEAVVKAQPDRYVRTALFRLFKFPFSDDDFKIDLKPYQHYVKLCSPLVGHTLMGNDKNEYMQILWGTSLQTIRVQQGKKRNVVIHQMWRAYECKL